MKYSFPAFENGFIRAAAASPALRVADCTYNADQIIGVMREYAEKNVQLLCLPEFALTGYTCSDLFLQDTLLRGAEDGLAAILKASEGLNLVVLINYEKCLIERDEHIAAVNSTVKSRIERFGVRSYLNRYTGVVLFAVTA